MSLKKRAPGLAWIAGEQRGVFCSNRCSTGILPEYGDVGGGQGAWQSYSALQPGFGRAVGLEDAMVQDGFLPGFVDPDPFRHRLDIIQPGRSILGASWFEKGLTYGLEVRDPTQDRQLIELCLAIPESQFQRDGVDRWLIRRAMCNVTIRLRLCPPRTEMQA